MENQFRLRKCSDEKKPTRYYSSIQEKSIAKAISGKQTPNSGATPFIKGDVLTEKWSFEAKTQTKSKKSFTLKKEWFEKQKQESLFMGKPYSAVVFNFGPNETNYYVLDELTFLELLESFKK